VDIRRRAAVSNSTGCRSTAIAARSRAAGFSILSLSHEPLREFNSANARYQKMVLSELSA
jgi:hypothetical protein